MPRPKTNQRIEQWFASRGWKPFAFQREVWRLYRKGESGMIHAATGTGKTYAAWLAPVIEYMEEGGSERTLPLRVLWITPLRALVADTEEALKLPIRDLGLPWRVESRTGDTTPGVRARQAKRLPAALVTTPESLSIFLARPNWRELFAGLRLIIVDEWHELMASKRGVQTELCLARLRTLCPQVRTWGLSATLGNLDVAMETLMGRHRGGQLVQGHMLKNVEIDAVIPVSMDRFPWAGHLGVHLLDQAISAIEEGDSTLVFTNTRSQCEIWYQAILEKRPDWAGTMAVHHGSLDRKTRDYVEDGLRKGKLRCVVCTSSLDLGVDYSPVDRVLQIGSPHGVARMLQRAGRSGHQPGAVSRITCIPTHAFELVETAGARDAARAGAIESRDPVERPLDVLAQHLVTVAVGGGFREEEMWDEVRSTTAYCDLTRREWEWTLDFVTRGGETLRAYPEYQRVVSEGGVYRVTDRVIAKRHLMTIGTISSDAAVKVQYVTGGVLGTIEEGFISRLKPGDCFLFAGRTLEFVRMRDMAAQVRRTKNRPDAAVPRWEGGRMPLSKELAEAVRRKLEEAREGRFIGAEMAAIRPVLEVQSAWSIIPALGELLIERTQTRDGYHVFLYPFEGRLVHQGLAALFAYRIGQLQPISFNYAANDYGIELLSASPIPIERALDSGLFSERGLETDILRSLNASQMAKRQFREVARIAGLVFPGYPGQGKTTRTVQASSGLIYEVFARYDPGNLLLDQAQREVLERELERRRLTGTLERLRRSKVRLIDTQRPTPFAFPLMIDIDRVRVSTEKLPDRVRRLLAELEKAAPRP
ncbi:MAG: ligase-associated DNA damage response DEXH box helicase [Bryobacteraceae bacterium]